MIRQAQYMISIIYYLKIHKDSKSMDNIKKLDALVLKATSESTEQLAIGQLHQILQLVNSRADMPKHVIASIGKRMTLKNKRVLLNCFTLIQYLIYESQLALYSQVSTKEFLFKISGLLMNKDVEPEVKTKIMETVFCCEELFRPHEDLLPLFFHFYAGLLRNNFQIPHAYKSPFRPAQLKQYKKPAQTIQRKPTANNSSKMQQPTTAMQRKTFEQIREKLILTNEIIDNSNPADNVKDNGLLLEMIEQIKDCEKKVNKTINQNPSQNLMEMALAANDDIFITYRRYKDLQRNKKPEPFVLTQLASDLQRQKVVKKAQSTSSNSAINATKNSPTKVQKQVSKQSSKQVDFMDFQEQPVKKVEKQPSKKQQNLFDMDFPSDPVKKQPVKQTGGDIFDLIDSSPQQPTIPAPVNQNINLDLFSQPIQPVQPVQAPVGSFDDLILTTNQFQGVSGIPPPSGNGITLNVNDFTTEADIKNYNNKNVMDRFQDLTYQFLKK